MADFHPTRGSWLAGCLLRSLGWLCHSFRSGDSTGAGPTLSIQRLAPDL